MPGGETSALIYLGEEFACPSQSVRRLSMPLAVLVGAALLSGCSGEENIPLKKVDFVLDDHRKITKRSGRRLHKGPSSKIGHDPSGVSKN